MGAERKTQGTRVIVTGAGRGIGREIALQFARHGATVVFHYSRSAEGAESAVREVTASGGEALALRANFDHLDEVVHLADRAIEALGGVDVLINNAGITFNKPFPETTPAQFEKMFNVNFRAQYFLTQRIVQDMLTRGRGAICNITSIHGLQAAAEHTLYAATKGAIIAYTRVLAIELAHKGIRVNAIAPGAIPVESHRRAVPDYSEEAQRQWAAKTIPLGQVGTPLDIAKLAVFLCSEDARFIVGQTIVADGGTTCLMSLMPEFRRRSALRFGAEDIKS